MPTTLQKTLQIKTHVSEKWGENCSCCHFTRIKRITLPVGRIDSGHRSLPHLKNAWVNPQTQEPLQVIQRQSTVCMACSSHADVTNSAVTETAEFGYNVGPGMVREQSQDGWPWGRVRKGRELPQQFLPEPLTGETC